MSPLILTALLSAMYRRGSKLLLLGLLMALGVGVSCAGPTSAPIRIRADQPSALVDMPVSIAVSGLPPNAQVSMEASATDCEGARYLSRATFLSDADGQLNLTETPPESGSYTGTHAMGLLWSMRPVTGSQFARYEFCIPHGGFDVTLTASVSGGGLAHLTLRRLWALPGVSEHDLRPSPDGLYGEYLSPAPMSGRRPGVLLLGGSEGGLSVVDDAALLASHGYPALALAYFAEPGLPATEQNIPLEYFARALTWLARQPGVDPTHLVVDGASRGGEVALLLGVYYPQLVHAVIAQTTSSVAECGFNASEACDGASWTFRGAAIPYTDDFRDPSPPGQPEAIIPVERIDGPILHDCGGLDFLIPSCLFGLAIEDRLTAARFPFGHELVTYQGAGHLVNAGVPYRPIFDGNLGGTLEANQLGVADFWSRQLAFLARVGN